LGPRTLRLTLPCLPPAEYGANRARGAAWQRQYRVSHGKQGAVDEIIGLVKEQGWEGPAMQRATIKIMFHLPDRRRRDGFGLLERMKPWLDGLVQGEMPVLRDDDLRTIGFPTADWCWDPGSPKTVVEITEIETPSTLMATRLSGDSLCEFVPPVTSYQTKRSGGRPRLDIPMSRIVEALRHEGNMAAAARALRCSPSYIRKRLKEEDGLPGL